MRKVKQVLDTNRRLTCDELAYDMGISYGLIYTIMRDKLNMRRVATFWVPHCFSEDQKRAHTLVAQTLLGRLENEGENFLNYKAASDDI